MSQKPIGRSPELKRLRAEGYNIEIRAGFLLVREVPYVTTQKEVRRGVLVVTLNLAGDVTTTPDTHVAYFAGEYPCDATGKRIDQIYNSSETKQLVAGVSINHTFSAKPKPSDRYDDYYHQVSTYCAILSGPAKVIDPAATAKTFSPAVPDDDENSVFNYLDTASSRAEIDVMSERLAMNKVAIVGLGGTGAYILDLVAKTPVRQIHLFDRDELLTHNAFRAPGAPSLDELRAKPRKVDYLAGVYSKMHRGIIAHPTFIDRENVDVLREMDFTFLSMEDAGAKRIIIEALEEAGKPFVDVGMGVYIGETGLGGILRVTASTPNQRQHVSSRITLAPESGDNDYGQNIQIADLNALNAALAVIKWKKIAKFYMDFVAEHHSTYGIEVQSLTKEDRAA